MGTNRHSPWIPRLLAMSTSSVLGPYVFAAVRVEHTRELTSQMAERERQAERGAAEFECECECECECACE